MAVRERLRACFEAIGTNSMRLTLFARCWQKGSLPEQKQTTIRQMELLLIHTLTQEREITVVLSIVKRAQLHRHYLPMRGDTSGELEERS